MCYLSVPVLLRELQVPGLRGLAARHDRQRVGVARRPEARLEQGVVQGEGGQLRRVRRLLRHRGQSARQVLVPGVLQRRKGLSISIVINF